jgi:hypothetical protein
MALHTGVAQERASDYFGPSLNRVARLLVAGHSSQVLLSRVTQELVCDALPPEVTLRDLGMYLLKDLTRPEHIFQLSSADLPVDFPPLRALATQPTNMPAPLPSLIGSTIETVGDTALLPTSTSPQEHNGPRRTTIIVAFTAAAVIIIATLIGLIPILMPASDTIKTLIDLNGRWAYRGTSGPVISVAATSFTIDMSAYNRPFAHGSIVDGSTITATFPDATTYTGKLQLPNTIIWSNGSVWTKVDSAGEWTWPYDVSAFWEVIPPHPA